MSDIDIDTHPLFKPSSVFKWARASVLKDEELTPHPCGYYPQRIAVDPVTKLAAAPYQEAEELGYLKVDFLHLDVYKHFKSRAEIEELLKKEPDWSLLQVPSIQVTIFQLGKHGDLLSDLKPQSVLEVADIMALIRPGKRRYLALYRQLREKIRPLLYAPDETGYVFKKSHSCSYAYVVLLQLHLIACYNKP